MPPVGTGEWAEVHGALLVHALTLFAAGAGPQAGAAAARLRDMAGADPDPALQAAAARMLAGLSGATPTDLPDAPDPGERGEHGERWL